MDEKGGDNVFVLFKSVTNSGVSEKYLHCSEASVALSRQDARPLPWHLISADSGTTAAAAHVSEVDQCQKNTHK